MLLVVAAVAALPSASADECSMVNTGVIVSVSGTIVSCGGCENAGVIVLVDTETDCADGCSNVGVAVTVGWNCFNEFGGYGANACIAQQCLLDTN